MTKLCPLCLEYKKETIKCRSCDIKICVECLILHKIKLICVDCFTKRIIKESFDEMIEEDEQVIFDHAAYT